jgi:hypothetical protein
MLAHTSSAAGCVARLRAGPVREAQQPADCADGARVLHLLARRRVVRKVAERGAHVLQHEVVGGGLEHGDERGDGAAAAEAVAAVGARAEHAERRHRKLDDVHRVLHNDARADAVRSRQGVSSKAGGCGTTRAIRWPAHIYSRCTCLRHARQSQAGERQRARTGRRYGASEAARSRMAVAS